MLYFAANVYCVHGGIMQRLLLNILMAIIALDVLALGVLVLFLYNARINLRRHIMTRRRHFRTIDASNAVPTSREAAELLGIPLNDFTDYCGVHGIELPEERIERIEKERIAKEEEQQRILAEEAAWRAEQEQLAEERRRAKEEEARRRRERLKKFGFR